MTKNPKVRLDLTKRLLIRSLLSAGLMLLSVQSYGQTAINTLPYTISQSGAYILTDDLLYTLGSGTAITITASHVTLDFNDHSIRCTGHGNNSNGVSVGAVTFVTIKNGIIQDFLRVAIWLGTASGGSLHVVENMKISENGTGMEVRASSCLIKDNLVNNANDYKVTIDERLLLLPLPKRLDLVASVPQIHTGAITGALIFEGTSLSGALGLFQRLGPFDC